MFISLRQECDIAGAIIPLFDNLRSVISNDRTDEAIAEPMCALCYPAECS